jgi:hypothetical protein
MAAVDGHPVVLTESGPELDVVAETRGQLQFAPVAADSGLVQMRTGRV